jgi:hypothetical protein
VSISIPTPLAYGKNQGNRDSNGPLFLLSKAVPRVRDCCPRLLAFLLLWVLSVSTATAQAAKTNSLADISTFCINYSANPDPRLLLAHDLAIVHPDATVPIETLHRAGVRALAYISVVEIASNARYRNRIAAAGIPILGRNPEWKSDLADVRSAAWRQFVVGELAAPAAEKGFDGFFLDTAESIELLAARDSSTMPAFREGLLRLIRDLRERFPGKTIVLNRGFRLQPDVFPLIDGLLVESLFQTFNFSRKTYQAVSESDTAWLLERLKPAQAAGVKVFVADFISPSDLPLADTTVERIRKLGFCPLIADPSFMGAPIAPVRPLANRVLVLYGKQGNVDEQGNAFYPADTWTARFVQMPLEWMGYHVEYYNAAADFSLPRLGPEHDAIMVDPWVQIPWSVQKDYARWIAQQIRDGRKVLLMGTVPFEEPESRARLWRAMGIQARWRLPPPFCRVDALRTVDTGMMNFEEKFRPVAFQYEGLTPPPKARVHLSVTAVTPEQKSFESALIFTAPWGGVALDPGTLFQRPDNVPLWHMDPFRFLAQALECDNVPAPDPTTLTGRRVFFSHIDADGFNNRSHVDRKKRSSEVIYEQILTKYPLPITVSVIEAEIRGHLANQTASDAKDLTAIAKKIFALPNVEAASHTYSHPFYWIQNDHTADSYDAQSMELLSGRRPPRIDLRREIEGSIQFINDHLLPPDKHVAVMQWSGNCRPGPEALRIARTAGVENINGGDTIISRQWPTLTAVSPRAIPWDGELQIRAGVQNEMLFTQSFRGPLYGGYVKVLQTFERTANPRRLKPVNIYYHMCSGDRIESLDALKTAYDWALRQPLRAVPASTYARMVRDAQTAKVYRASRNEWILLSGGPLQTFRMAAGSGVPDMNASQGLIGYCVEDGYLYLSTDGSGRTRVVLTSSPPPHLFLESSSSEIRFDQLKEKQARFSVRDFRPVMVTLGGSPPNIKAEVTANSTRSHTIANAKGRLTLQLPPSANVEVKIP